MADLSGEKRVNDILLGPIERPALVWLAAHMPQWVTPDFLTILGFLASILIFVSYWLTNISSWFLWLASFAFLLNWFGDSLDGSLARYRKIERPRYGFFVDHTVDAVSEVLVFLGIGLSPYVDFRLASLALIGYLLLSILIFIKTYVDGIFRISWAHLGPTEMRVIAILANTLVFFIGNPMISLPFGRWSLYNVILFALTLTLFIAYLVIVLQQASYLASVEKAKTNPVPAVTIAKSKKKKNGLKTRGIVAANPQKKTAGRFYPVVLSFFSIQPVFKSKTGR